MSLIDLSKRGNTMKKGIVAAVLAVGLGVGAAATAAPAQADEISYLNQLTRSGIAPIDGDYVTLLRWGYAVCADSRMWVPLEVSTRNVYSAPQNSLTLSQAGELVVAAQVYLC